MTSHRTRYWLLIILSIIVICCLRLTINTYFSLSNFKYIKTITAFGLSYSIEKETPASIFFSNSTVQGRINSNTKLLFCYGKKYSILGMTYVNGVSGALVNDFLMFCKLIAPEELQIKRQQFLIAVDLLTENNKAALQQLAERYVDRKDK